MANRVKYVLDLENIMNFVFDSNINRDSESEITEMYLLDEETNDMVFLVDGEEVGTSATAFSSATNMTYITHEVPVGKNKTVTIRAKNFAPLRILAIIERVAE